MKMNHTLAAALLMGLSSGTMRQPKSITSANRLHSDRAPRGSALEAERIAAAERRRRHRAAKRAAQS